jgi:thiol:disulfide interchange protein
MTTNFFSSRRLLAFPVCVALTWIAVHALGAAQPPATPDKVQYDPFSDLHAALPDANKTLPLPSDVDAINPLKSPPMLQALPDSSKKDTGPDPATLTPSPGWKPKPAPSNPKGLKDVLHFEVKVHPQEAKPGQLVRVTVVGMPAEHWHTFALTKRTPDQVDVRLKFNKDPVLQPLPPVVETEPVLTTEEISAKETAKTWQHSSWFSWSFDVLVQPNAPAGAQTLKLVVATQACSKVCIPGKIELTAAITVVPGDTAVLSDAIDKRLQEKWPAYMMYLPVEHVPQPNVAKEPAPRTTAIVGLPRDYKSSMERVFQQLKPAPVNLDFNHQGHEAEQGLLGFMLVGMLWGFITLLTPCVFPMIPITVSFFLKQSEKEHHKPITMALVYCGTIVVVLTIAAAALLHAFRLLSISPYMNFGLGLLFIAFALSLFGMYDIELPSFLGRFTSEREGKGGLLGTFFMALTFTIISFACVAPFLGGFGGTAANEQRPWWHSVLGGFAFSCTFASPFFILALFPTLLKAMPKSGAWLNSIKVVMGFLELAAAFKFFRAGELVFASEKTSLFTYDLVLGLWIGLCFLCGMYLLGIYRLPHDSPVEHLSVPRMLFSFLFLGLGLYMMPALFSPPPEEGVPPRPDGDVYAWVNSFLLPEPRTGAWSGNLEQAIAQAREYQQKTGQPKLIFVDFTGKNCSNCKINENSVFTRSQIRTLLRPYLLVQLYTDSVPLEFYPPEDQAQVKKSNRQIDDAQDVNSSFQFKAFGTEQLPLYVILEPRPDNTVWYYTPYSEGKINDVSGFAEFLRLPQEKAGDARAGL